MSSCYSSWIKAKTGISVPLYTDGKPALSLYDPEKEARNFAAQDCFKDAGFIFVAGLANGLHIEELIKKYPAAHISVIEANTASLHFLLGAKKTFISPNLKFCIPEHLDSFILENYFPPIDGKFVFSALHSWANYNAAILKNIKTRLEKTLAAVSADISAQAHFGKLWKRNILQNLQSCESLAKNRLVDLKKTIFPVSKTAFIAAAGPSLELWFKKLSQNRSDYFIIAADTAHHSLMAQNIIPDAVITIDPQHISALHFMQGIKKQTLLACDLCANPASVRPALKSGSPILFFKNAHPLSQLADFWHTNIQQKAEYFPVLSSGSGTVSLTAMDLAVQCGFQDIQTGGADFAFLNGKPYTAGTYLDILYSVNASKLHPIEQQFCSLMFRTDLIFAEGERTNDLLQQYKKSFDEFIKRHRLDQKMISDQSHSQKKNKFQLRYCSERFFAKDFLQWYSASLQDIGCKTEQEPYIAESIVHKAIMQSLLPYAAWYGRRMQKKPNLKELAALLSGEI